MYKWRISVPVTNRVMPHALFAVYNSLMSDTGFTLTTFTRFTRQSSAGMSLVTHIEFNVLHHKPSALTSFILRYPRLEFTVTELCL